jgi:hypothetical protein
MLVISGFGAQSETQSALQKRVDDFVQVFGKTPTTYAVYRFFRSLAEQFEFTLDAVPLLKAKLDPLHWPDIRLDFTSRFAGSTTTPEIEEALDAAVRTVRTFDDLKNWLRQFPAEPPVIRQIAGGRAQIIPSLEDPRAELFNEVAVAKALEAIAAEERTAASRAATSRAAAQQATAAQFAQAKRRKIAIGAGIAVGVIGLGALGVVLGRRSRVAA